MLVAVPKVFSLFTHPEETKASPCPQQQRCAGHGARMPWSLTEFPGKPVQVGLWCLQECKIHCHKSLSPCLQTHSSLPRHPPAATASYVASETVSSLPILVIQHHP